ncbi:hypothetical protein PV516_19310 [Streptomyces scabiei]|uniref:hypothetical protein n=1 Tax=Streptomyces scabiei TaxID=1930 RepID=UPI0029BED166|nr:hypothetical protein [Streptomyces scabiei]MDX3165938.1 hypothetical protein [Streptomyces scabiei]
MTPHFVYLDTEFDPRNPALSGLLSLGMTDNASPAADYYAINTDADLDALADHPFIPDHVLPYLPVTVTRGPDGTITGITWDKDHPDFQTYGRPAAQIAEEVEAYFPGETEAQLLANYGKDDLGYLHRLFGNDWNTMAPGIPRVPADDLESLRRRLGAPEPPAHPGDQHHALADARYNRAYHRHLLRFQQSQLSAPPSDRHAALYIDRDGDPWVEYLTLPRSDHVIQLVMASVQTVERSELEEQIGALRHIGWCAQ